MSCDFFNDYFCHKSTYRKAARLDMRCAARYSFFPPRRINLDNSFSELRRILLCLSLIHIFAESDAQEYRVIRLSTQMYYLGLISTYDSMYTNGTDAEKNAYLETWAYFTELLKKYPIRFDVSDGTFNTTMSDSDSLLKDFDITVTNPAAVSYTHLDVYKRQ